jgi:sarcosine oxidase, subunit beta
VARSGSFLIARTAQHREFLRRELAQSRRWGADVREASGAQVASQLSYYQAASEEFALWCPEDVYIHEPASLVRAYQNACQLNGTMVLEKEPVVGIRITNGCVAGVETSGRSIAAPVVVDAAGGWVRQVAALALVSIPLWRPDPPAEVASDPGQFWGGLVGVARKN